MAKVTLGPMVGQASGSIGAAVFSHNRGGTYIRRRAIPKKSTTPYALAAKALMTTASQAWQSLLVADQNAWNEWAATNPIMDVLGFSRTLTGHAAWVGIYVRLFKLGQAPPTHPPLNPPPPGLTAVSIAPDKTGGTCVVTFADTPLGAGHVLWFQACYLGSPGIHWVRNRLRWCPISSVAPASGYDAYANITSRLGAMTIGQRLAMYVSVGDGTNGLISSPLRCEGVIV